MSRYRDELTATRARAESLESALEEREQEIAELESRLAARDAQQESDATPDAGEPEAEEGPAPKRHRRRLVRLEARAGIPARALLVFVAVAIVVGLFVLMVAL